MVAPGLDDARAGRHAVDPAESLEDIIAVAAEDLHRPIPLVGDDVDFLDLDTVLHYCHRSAYRSICFLKKSY